MRGLHRWVGHLELVHTSFGSAGAKILMHCFLPAESHRLILETYTNAFASRRE